MRGCRECHVTVPDHDTQCSYYPEVEVDPEDGSVRLRASSLLQAMAMLEEIALRDRAEASARRAVPTPHAHSIYPFDVEVRVSVVHFDAMMSGRMSYHITPFEVRLREKAIVAFREWVTSKTQFSGAVLYAEIVSVTRLDNLCVFGFRRVLVVP